MSLRRVDQFVDDRPSLSALLKIIFREIIPTEGQIVIEGVNILRIPDHGIYRLRRMMGIVFQDFRLLFHRPVYENVALPLQVLGVPFKEILRLEGLRPEGLGDVQRVGIVRAIKRSILPTTAVDFHPGQKGRIIAPSGYSTRRGKSKIL